MGTFREEFMGTPIDAAIGTGVIPSAAGAGSNGLASSGLVIST
jgi:hypothetical protein